MCTPFTPSPGLFDSIHDWSPSDASPWSFGLASGSTTRFDLRRSGTLVQSLDVPWANTATGWLFFGGASDNNFLAVRAAVQSSGFVNYRLFVYDLRNPAAVPAPWSISDLNSAGGGTPQLHVQFHLPNGELLFLFIGGDGVVNETHSHRVYRTDNGQSLCSYAPLTRAAARHAEVTPSGKVRILTLPGQGPRADYPNGGDLVVEQPLPMGATDVSPDVQDFGEVVVGGPTDRAASTRTFTIRNSGNDCLCIESIVNAPPYSVVRTSVVLPACLNPGESVSIDVEFRPASAGSYGNSSTPFELIITRSPAQGDSALKCRGTARTPQPQISVTPTNLTFGTVPVGENRTENVTVRNTGETALTLTSNSPASGSGFGWTPLSGRSLAVGASVSVGVTFTPDGAREHSDTLSITSQAPGSPHPVTLRGVGCIPEARISVPPGPFPHFQEVPAGFRTVRFIVIGNDGSGRLEFRARIIGADSGLFGLQNDSGSVTEVRAQRTYTVNPMTPCGAGTAGNGTVSVGVVFFANDAAGPATAQLVIDQHNAVSAGQSSWSFDLHADIVPPPTLDAALVFDRSGSMADALGERRKVEAAVSAGRLFAEMIPPDVGNRVAIVKFNEQPELVQSIVHVRTAGNPTQAAILNKINANELAPNGWTGIAGGIITGVDQVSQPRTDTPPLLTKSVIVLTDGMDNQAFLNPSDGKWYSLLGGEVAKPGGGMVMTEPLSLPAGIRVYGIGLGRNEDVDAGRLDVISNMTNGYFGVVGELAGPSYFNLEKHYVQVFMDAVNLSSLVDPQFTIQKGEKHIHEFDVLRGDVGAMVVLFDHEDQRLPLYLLSPHKEVINSTSAPQGYQLRFGATAATRFLEIRFPLRDQDRYAGRWAVVIEHPGRVFAGAFDRKDKNNGFVPEKYFPTDKPVDYGIAIGVGSNFRMQPFVTPGIVHVGEPILLSALVSEAGLAVTGCTVTVTAESPSGVVHQLNLRDDGAHQDGEPDDGEYACAFAYTAEAGSYRFTFRAVGKSRDGEPVMREAVRAKYVEGIIPIGPDVGGKDDRCCEEILERLDTLIKVLGGKPNKGFTK